MAGLARSCSLRLCPLGPSTHAGGSFSLERETSFAVTLGNVTDAKSSAWRLLLVWLAISVVLTAIQFQYPEGLRSDIPYLLVAASLAVVAWLGAVRLRGTERLVGMLLAAGLTASSTGDLISIAIGWWQGAEPEASVADVAWLMAYVGIGGGLILLLRRGARGQRRDIDGLIDVAAVFVAGMMVIWRVAVAATVADTSLPVWIRVVWGLYPVLDVALLALVLRLIMRDRSLATVLVASGVAMWLAADFAYLMIANAASYSIALDAGWLWGGILIALAVLYGPARSRAEVAQQEIDRVGLGRILVALLPLLVPAGIEVVGFIRGRDPNPWVLGMGTVVLVLLAFARMVRLASSARAARAALESRKRYVSALAANSSDAVVVVDSDLRLMEDFPQLAALIGYPGRDNRGRHLLTMVAPEDLEETRAAVNRCLASPGQVFDVEVRVRHGAGGQIWLAARVVNLLEDPDVRGIVVNLHDITRRKQAEEELGYQAFHDALTGLANRALFRDRLNHALDRSAGTGTEPAVIFLDLDGFKTINDSLGHDAGDDLLRETAERLLTVVRRGDTVGRLGGDEFAILIEQSSRPLDQAIAVADRLLQALKDPVQLGEQTVTVTASLGVAIGNGSSDSATLLRDADIAMYRSKATGKNKWTAYSPGMRTAALERLELETGLHVALERDEFRLFYQPVVELESERVVGFEALLRWQHPRQGLLPPDRFVPLAEETGLIVPIGRWVLHEAATTAARWQQQFRLGRQLTMAVNLSARQLTAPDLVDDVAHALTTSGLDPGSLVLEMTETVLVQDAALAAARLQELHQLGIRLAIDDFGTGYSSLSYLRQFPVDILKIDRTFVSTITDRESTPAIVRGLLDLGRTLQLETVAEGVELDLQRTRLRDENCTLAQGFLFARPMPLTDAERLLGELDLARTASASQPKV
jgi:diguanylate cyclase (GGDEF)-like protein/PAS domain S-box-containing protein